MLIQATDGLTEICISATDFSTETVVAILKHQDTLNELYTFTRDEFYDSEAIPETKNGEIDTDGWTVQSLPRHCTRLKIPHLPLFEMDMDDIEDTTWGCHDLEELHMRVLGLDTKERIDRAIQLWKEGRIVIMKGQVNGEQEESAFTRFQLDCVIPPDDQSIEARVARHLLKFKKLQEVWLGWKIRKVRN